MRIRLDVGSKIVFVEFVGSPLDETQTSRLKACLDAYRLGYEVKSAERDDGDDGDDEDDEDEDEDEDEEIFDNDEGYPDDDDDDD